MKASSSLDRLTVILSPVLSAEERERAALEHCGGSLTKGDGWGYGCEEIYGGWGEANGDGRGCGLGYEDGCGWGDGTDDGYGWGSGNGESAPSV